MSKPSIFSTGAAKPSLGSIGAVRRRKVSVSSGELVKTSYLDGVGTLPLVMEPAVEGVNLIQWASENRQRLNDELVRHGGILFRGFGLAEVEEFERFVAALAPELLEYTYRSTPRTRVSGKIFTSTEYPADQHIPMHNEMSYTRSWPRKIWFFSVVPAATGGETPLADSRLVYQRIPSEIRDAFEAEGVMYVRNYASHIDLPWQEVFQTESKDEVAEFCRQSGIELEWLGENHLRTRQVCQAVIDHPQTGDKLWFNQAHLFHVSSLPAEVRDAFLADLGEDNLARNTYYGDGRPIEPETLAAIRAAFDDTAIAFPWQRGDLVMLDNMMVAHGRRPYTGERKVVVGMAEMTTLEEL